MTAPLALAERRVWCARSGPQDRSQCPCGPSRPPRVVKEQVVSAGQARRSPLRKARMGFDEGQGRSQPREVERWSWQRACSRLYSGLLLVPRLSCCERKLPTRKRLRLLADHQCRTAHPIRSQPLLHRGRHGPVAALPWTGGGSPRARHAPTGTLRGLPRDPP